MHQDVDLWVAALEPGQRLAHRLPPGHHAWVQVARGAVTLNGIALKAGDGAAAVEEKLLEIRASEASEILLFDQA